MRALGGFSTETRRRICPSKNATGVDSAESSVQIASDLFKVWLEEQGVTVNLADNQRIEISPLFAGSREHFAERWDGRFNEISGDLYLEEDEV